MKPIVEKLEDSVGKTIIDTRTEDSYQIISYDDGSYAVIGYPMNTDRQKYFSKDELGYVCVKHRMMSEPRLSTRIDISLQDNELLTMNERKRLSQFKIELHKEINRLVNEHLQGILPIIIRNESGDK